MPTFALENKAVERAFASISFGLTTLSLAALLFASCGVASPIDAHVSGHIDGLRLEGSQFHIWGWACQLGSASSIDVEIYADHSAGKASRGILVISGSANLESESAIANICQDAARGKHRFLINLPGELLTTFQGRKLFINGVKVGGGVDSSPLARSGELQFPKPPVFRSAPAVYPRLPGTYRRSSDHPRVFTTQLDLNELAKRINTAGSFSAKSFARLANRVEHDFTARTDWDATYSGCDIDIYLHAFSIEATGGYAGEIRTEAQLRAALDVQPNAGIPAGAAIVASRFALYASLAKAGTTTPSDAPSPEQAIALAKRILLAWADRGFRGERGNLRQSSAEFCGGAGRPAGAAALQISRGVVYTVHAQDLLQGLNAFSRDEISRLDRFHGAMHEVIRSLSNQQVDEGLAGRYPDETFNNQIASHLAGLLATARLLDDPQRFEAALYGGAETAAVKLPWVMLFDHLVYGPADRPLLRVTPNNGPDSLSSKPAFTTPSVAAGEINDRYRNDNPLQGIGYPMGTLQWLFDAAEIMKNTGIDAYRYSGAHQQSIEMAAQYYACYGKSAGFYAVVTPANAGSCPNYQQYVGRVVNQVESAVLIGAYRFPHNEALASTQAEARAAWLAAPDSLDTVRFGKWRE